MSQPQTPAPPPAPWPRPGPCWGYAVFGVTHKLSYPYGALLGLASGTSSTAEVRAVCLGKTQLRRLPDRLLAVGSGEGGPMTLQPEGETVYLRACMSRVCASAAAQGALHVAAHLGPACARLPGAWAPRPAGQRARRGGASVGGASRGRGPGPARAAARPAAQERASGEPRQSAPVPSRTMLPWTVLGLALSLRLPRSGAERGLPASVPQGDLLFLLDSSASVSHYEFSRVREFLGQLAALLPLGPGALHASLVHVGSQPHTEFPFGQHSSGSTVQDAIRAAAQRMGDTNTGLALAYAKEQLFAEEAGARPGVPKVLVWVTDGGSSDPVGPPMQELKDLGVTVFIVSTGRGNLLELSAAASPPAEKHLHFVDVDDLHMITQELRGSVLDAMWPQQLRASEVTSSGFRLAWPPLLTPDSGYYVLELMPSAKQGTVLRQQLPGNATGWAWAGLDPDTEYNVELMPESNVRLLRPQHLRVRTLPEETGPERIVVSHARPRSLRVSWAPALGPAAALGYHVQVGPLLGGAAQRVEVPAGRNSTTLQGLAPGTAYLVTVTAAFRSGRERALSAKACTPDGERSRAPRPQAPEAGGREP
ncbi:von Willebrand factor A domain-containing protein 1 isoform X2 [Camelus bactrianus]|uniref:von Willebrand factor A domain-containing protein 1 isoform X2 n=1 Tax=Camelus bactrianus TaxID=9837 RepID=A0AC58RH17_CAMBA